MASLVPELKKEHLFKEFFKSVTAPEERLGECCNRILSFIEAGNEVIQKEGLEPLEKFEAKNSTYKKGRYEQRILIHAHGWTSRRDEYPSTDKQADLFVSLYVDHDVENGSMSQSVEVTASSGSPSFLRKAGLDGQNEYPINTGEEEEAFAKRFWEALWHMSKFYLKEYKPYIRPDSRRLAFVKEAAAQADQPNIGEVG